MSTRHLPLLEPTFGRLAFVATLALLAWFMLIALLAPAFSAPLAG